WFYIGEFYANLPSVSLGVMLCALATLLFEQALQSHDSKCSSTARLISTLLLASILVGGALGAYQSFLTAFACMALGTAIFRGRVARDTRPRLSWKRIIALAGVLGAAVVF